MFKEKASMKDVIMANADRMRGLFDNINIRTQWEWEFFHRAKSGRLIKFAEHLTPNVCTTEGINHLLDVGFHGSTPVSPWSVFLFEDNYTPLVTNTYASKGCTECTAYGEETRPAYVEAAASNKVMTNAASKAVFTFNDTKTIYGGGLVSDSTKGDSAASGAVLFCSSKLSSSQEVISTDVLRVTVAITGADT